MTRRRTWRADLREDAARLYTCVAVIRRLVPQMGDLVDRERLITYANVLAAEARRLDMEADRR